MTNKGYPRALNIKRLTGRLAGGLLAVLLSGGGLSGCQPAPQTLSVSVPVDVRYLGQSVDCRHSFEHRGQAVKLADLKMFVSQIALNADTQTLPLTPTPSIWSHQSLLLLDWEDGSGACAETGNPAIQARIQGEVTLPADVEAGDLRGLTFAIGVPFAVNHLNPLTQPSPLNLSSMFWSWQLGHKFLRLDLETPDGGWAFHLGSTGCRSASAVRAPEARCDRPNRAVVQLADWRPGQALTLELSALLNGLALTPTSRCMGEVLVDNHCAALMQRLGLDPRGGMAVSPAQQLFQVAL